MELSNDWHKRTNVRLADILSDILKEPRPPKVPKPTHGYTIAEKAPEVVTAPGVYFPAKKGRVIPLESRQAGGPVTPTRTLQQMLEKLASYAPFPIPGAAGQSRAARERVEGRGENRLETAIEPKQPPLVSRQDGGEVDPNLFKEKFSVNFGDPTQQGIEAAANTASLKDTPINVSPLTPSLQSFAPGANPTPTGQGNPINNSMEQRLNSISRGLSLMIKPPKPFKYKGLQHGFESEQRAAYDKKYKPYQDFMSSLNPTPLFSRDRGGATSPDPLEGLSEEERKRRIALLKKALPIESLASSRVTTPPSPIDATMTQKMEEREIPNTELTKPSEVKTPASLSEIRKDILPSGETRYTLPGTEGTATVGPERFFMENKEVPAGTIGAVSGDELARQRILKEATPPDLRLPEKTYYEAHPEERFMDLAREENKPLMDMYQKLIEENKMRAGGFGLPMGRKAARLIRAEATRAVPELTQGLERMMALNQAIPEKYFGSEARAGKVGTPLYTNEDKYSMSFYGKSYRDLDESKRKVVDTKVKELKPLVPEKAPGRKSEVTFDPSTGQTYQQDFEWEDGIWQSAGEKRVVGGPQPLVAQGLKINKLNVIRKMLDEDYANQIKVDVNDVHRKLSPIQKEAYNRILAFAEKNAERMDPRAALDQAHKDWYATLGQKQRKPLSSFEGK